MRDGNTIQKGYDTLYAKPNHFAYRAWLFRPLIRALLHQAGVRPGSRVLDVGCGQGFFANLLADHKLKVVGIDLSEIGVRVARTVVDVEGASFVVGDAQALPFSASFDSVFCRSLSTYNTKQFRMDRRVTEALLRCVKPGGRLIFLYNTHLRNEGAAGEWCNHTLADASEHFSAFEGARAFFSIRYDCVILRTLALRPSISRLNCVVSRYLRVGGELACIIPKPRGIEGRG